MTSENAANGTARRIALVVAYDGADYAGFQSQVGVPTIQNELEKAIAKLTGIPSRVRGASRTDAGAHACGQVVDFATESELAASVFVRALNYYLPEAIRVLSACDMPLRFHSRYDAAHREYRYSILNREVASPLLRRTHHLETAPLELANIQRAAISLLGIRDFRRITATLPGRPQYGTQGSQMGGKPPSKHPGRHYHRLRRQWIPAPSNPARQCGIGRNRKRDTPDSRHGGNTGRTPTEPTPDSHPARQRTVPEISSLS